MSLACYTQSLPPLPLRYPHPHLKQQHNTCVQLREATLDEAGEEADGIRWRNLKSISYLPERCHRTYVLFKLWLFVRAEPCFKK